MYRPSEHGAYLMSSVSITSKWSEEFEKLIGYGIIPKDTINKFKVFESTYDVEIYVPRQVEVTREVFVKSVLSLGMSK